MVIPPGVHVLLDTHTESLGSLTIAGFLEADSAQSVGITAEHIDVESGGRLQIGTAGAPYSHLATITLTGAPGPYTSRYPKDSGFETEPWRRALLVHDGGQLSLYGQVPSVVHTSLNASAQGSDASLMVSPPPAGWRQFDQIAVGPTDFHGVATTKICTLQQPVPTNPVAISPVLGAFRYGQLQFVSMTAPYLTTTPPGAGQPMPPDDVPAVLDQRAPVAHLTRRIVIQGADDAHWAAGFGAHVMVHGPHEDEPYAQPTSVAQVCGVQFVRCGQISRMGRYPMHWHMLSCQAKDPALRLPAPPFYQVSALNHFIRDCSIVGSRNRAVVIHGTSGVAVERNVAVDILGHAFFLEDGSEIRNTIHNNVAMNVRDPGAPVMVGGQRVPGGRIKVHDQDASGFWITNPDNSVVENRACDAVIGIWNSFSELIFGLSYDGNYERSAANPGGFRPRTTTLWRHEGNIAHSCFKQGIITDRPVQNEAGEIGYAMRSGGYFYDKYKPPTATVAFSGNKIWKNGVAGYSDADGYHNRVEAPVYEGWIAADNRGRDFFGATKGGAIRKSLFVAQSLNSVQNGSIGPGLQRRRGVSSYHYTIDVNDIVAIGYAPSAVQGPPVVESGEHLVQNGFLASPDLYVFGVAVGGQRHNRWTLLGSHPGFLNPSPAFEPDASRNWTLAGAIHDPHGRWGSAGNYLIPDNPFYTNGLTTSPLPSGIAQPTHPFVQTTHRFLGVDWLQANGITENLPVNFHRLSSSGTSNPGSVVGTHVVGSSSAFYKNMRSFALANGHHYQVDLPGLAVNRLQFQFTNSRKRQGQSISSIDTVLLRFPWTGGSVYGRITSAGVWTPVKAASSLTNLVDPPAGTTSNRYWLGGGFLWVRLTGELDPNPWRSANDPDPNLFWLNAQEVEFQATAW